MPVQGVWKEPSCVGLPSIKILKLEYHRGQWIFLARSRVDVQSSPKNLLLRIETRKPLQSAKEKNCSTVFCSSRDKTTGSKFYSMYPYQSGQQIHTATIGSLFVFPARCPTSIHPWGRRSRHDDGTTKSRRRFPPHKALWPISSMASLQDGSQPHPLL